MYSEIDHKLELEKNISEAEKKGNNKEKCIYLLHLGKYYIQTWAYDQSKGILEEALVLAQNYNLDDEKAEILSLLADLHYGKNELMDAYKIYHESFEVAKKRGIEKILRKLDHAISITKMYLPDLMEEHLKSAFFAENNNDFAKALDYYDRALKICETLNLKDELSKVQDHISNVKLML